MNIQSVTRSMVAQKVPKDVAPTSTWIKAARAFVVLGVLWNAFGVVQFFNTLNATRESLMASGLSESQALLYLGLPMWLNLAFAVGVFAGLAGSLLLALRKRLAVPVLAVSLGAYAVLFVGDAALGLFAAIPNQLAILSVVLGMAIALMAIAVWYRRSAQFR